MYKTRNKNGSDTDVGIRRTLARVAEVIVGQPPPWMGIRYGPPCTVGSRGDPPGERWRSDNGYVGMRPLVPKSPGPLVSQVERECELRAAPRDFVTLGQPDESPPGIVNRLIVNNIDSSARNRMPARRRLKHGVLKDIYCLTATTMPKRIVKKVPRKDAMTQRHTKDVLGFRESVWMYGESSIGAAVPCPPSFVPFSKTIESLEQLIYLNN